MVTLGGFQVADGGGNIGLEIHIHQNGKHVLPSTHSWIYRPGALYGCKVSTLEKLIMEEYGDVFFVSCPFTGK